MIPTLWFILALLVVGAINLVTGQLVTGVVLWSAAWAAAVGLLVVAVRPTP